MRVSLPVTIVWTAFAIPVVSDCRHPNGNIQTDAYHAPCADVLGNPLNTMCCAIERPNPSGGAFSEGGLAADICLPNGLCKHAWKQDENSTMTTDYWREECTVDGWKNGTCLTVCLSNSASSNVIMTPCDGTDNSTKWCCGDNKDCCAGDVGVETLAQTFLGAIATSTSSSASSAASSASTSSSSSTTASSSSSSSRETASASSSDSTGISAGAIAGIVIGAVIGIALIAAAWFLISRRRRNDAAPSIDELPALDGHVSSSPQKTYYAYEADASEQKVSELPGSNAVHPDRTVRAHELQ